MRVASAHGFGTNPEDQAWTQILSWARGEGLLDDRAAHGFFGFNNPDPSPGSPNYGYEQWITVEPDAEPAEGIEVKTFPGGLYAVARCTLGRIGEVWKQLATWREDSPYKDACHQWLEEALSPPADPQFGPAESVLDLYLPIAE
jgi:DNA gyrase inhibitor GyrI